IADPVNAPTRLTAIDTGVIGLLSVSAAGRVSYVKTFDGTSLTDLFVRKGDASAPACTLTAKIEALTPSLQFSRGTDAALWARSTAGGFEAIYTRFADCS